MTAATGRHRASLIATPEEGTILTINLGGLGREPALALIGVAGPLAAILVSLIPGISPGWQTTVETLVYAAAGVLTALVVRSDKLAPALLGLGQALLNLALAAGAHLDDAQQTAIMTAASLLIAAFVRTQVIAPLPPTLSPARSPESPATAPLSPVPFEQHSTASGMPYMPDSPGGPSNARRS